MSEDVSRFLSQVKELGERRVEEDEARSRELEEKILQDRKERQARRRGKSLSSPPLSSLVALVTLVTHTILHFTLSAFQALGPVCASSWVIGSHCCLPVAYLSSLPLGS